MRIAALVLLVLVASRTPSMAAELGDPESGGMAAAGCTGCHESHSVDFSGREASDLVARMLAIRDGRDDKHPPVLGLLDDKQIVDIAAFLSTGARK